MGKRSSQEKHTRRVVLVIVEGQSDENALAVPLTEYFESKYGDDALVYFAMKKNSDGTKGGDITSLWGATTKTMHMLMNKLIIMPCILENSLMPKYVAEIVQIIDMDGAYIPDAHVVFDSTILPDESPKYCDSAIKALTPDSIIKRNERKRYNIAALLEYCISGFEIQNFHDNGYISKPTTKSTRVPYSVYFFSCNLDHFICGNANLDKYYKVRQADEFARKYGNDLQTFEDYLAKDPDSIKNVTLEESWAMIQEECNSIHRSTNLHLLFESINGRNNA